MTPEAAVPIELVETVCLQLWGIASEEEQEEVQEALRRAPGVLRVELAADRNVVEVSYDPTQTGPQRLVDAVWCSSRAHGGWHGASIRS